MSMTSTIHRDLQKTLENRTKDLDDREQHLDHFYEELREKAERLKEKQEAVLRNQQSLYEFRDKLMREEKQLKAKVISFEDERKQTKQDHQAVLDDMDRAVKELTKQKETLLKETEEFRLKKSKVQQKLEKIEKEHHSLLERNEQQQERIQFLESENKELRIENQEHTKNLHFLYQSQEQERVKKMERKHVLEKQKEMLDQLLTGFDDMAMDDAFTLSLNECKDDNEHLEVVATSPTSDYLIEEPVVVNETKESVITNSDFMEKVLISDIKEEKVDAETNVTPEGNRTSKNNPTSPTSDYLEVDHKAQKDVKPILRDLKQEVMRQGFIIDEEENGSFVCRNDDLQYLFVLRGLPHIQVSEKVSLINGDYSKRLKALQKKYESNGVKFSSCDTYGTVTAPIEGELSAKQIFLQAGKLSTIFKPH